MQAAASDGGSEETTRSLASAEGAGESSHETMAARLTRFLEHRFVETIEELKVDNAFAALELLGTRDGHQIPLGQHEHQPMLRRVRNRPLRARK